MAAITNNILVKRVESRGDVTAFIKMMWPLYRNHPNWVPPLIFERREILDRKKNPFFRHAEMELFLAYRGREVVGRIAALINHNHNTFHDENIGFFGFFESVDDSSIASALVDAAKEWCVSKGVTAMRGPVNPSTNDDIGVLVEGFDKPPAIMMTYNPEYYDELLQGTGLVKIKDVYSYYVNKRNVFSDKLVRVMERLKDRETLEIRPINMKDFRNELEKVKVVYNNAWARNWGFIPMTDAEFDHMAATMKQIIDPRIVLLAERKGEPIGFGLSVPDINQILIRNKKGRLIPGVIRLLMHKKKINFIRTIVLGVRKEYQGGSAGALLFYETAVRGISNGYYHGEAGWVLEDNAMMNRAAAFLNAERYKTYRLYEISL